MKGFAIINSAKDVIYDQLLLVIVHTYIHIFIQVTVEYVLIISYAVRRLQEDEQ